MSEEKNTNQEQKTPVNSVIAARLSVAETIDTTLTEEEEKMYEKAASASRSTSRFHKNQWIMFIIMMIVMIGFLIWTFTYYIQF